MLAEYPWLHLMVDDFLHKDDLEELSRHPIKDVPEFERRSLLNNQVHKDGRVVSEALSPSTVKRLHDRYHKRSMEMLRTLAPRKVALYEYADYELVITGSKCAFPIHHDTWDKLLSIVVYLAPESNAGTILYDNNKGLNPINVEWKVNRALVFSRMEGKTWHAYKGDGVNNRLALVYNLMTTNKSGVYAAEGESRLKVELMNQVRKFGKLFGRRKVKPST